MVLAKGRPMYILLLASVCRRLAHRCGLQDCISEVRKSRLRAGSPMPGLISQ